MMLTLILLLAQVAAIAAPTEEADRRFALAAELYEAADYEAAAVTYASILDLGWTSGALYHNTGQAYLRAGRLGPAVLHLERAARHLPDNPAVQAHLAQARAQVQGEEGALAASPVADAANWIADALTPGGLLALALLAWCGMLALPGWRVWRGPQLSATQQTRVRRGLLVAAPLAAVLLAVTVLASVERHAARAVVLEPWPLAFTPGASPEGADVAEGLVVRLGPTRGTWQAVQLPDGTEGWLPAAALGRI